MGEVIYLPAGVAGTFVAVEDIELVYVASSPYGAVNRDIKASQLAEAKDLTEIGSSHRLKGADQLPMPRGQTPECPAATSSRRAALVVCRGNDLTGPQAPLRRRCSSSRGIISTKLQGMCR